MEGGCSGQTSQDQGTRAGDVRQSGRNAMSDMNGGRGRGGHPLDEIGHVPLMFPAHKRAYTSYMDEVDLALDYKGFFKTGNFSE